ncbi:MAG: HD domain-containing protein [Bacilli bacterium]|nr:HD domain-containing protein [Bacilli bacterium]
MNKYLEEYSYFFNNIYPYLGKKEQKMCLKELKRELKYKKIDEKKELEKILLKDDIVKSIEDNKEILLAIIPELNDMIDFEHNHPHHHLDVWNHTICALSYSYKDFDLRLCLLLHDIGKPHSYQDGDVRHFKGHPKASSNISRTILNRLGYEKDYVEEICYLIENHDNPLTYYDILDNFDLTLKRYLIQYCDALAHNPEKLEKRIKYLKSTLEKFKECKPNIEKKVKTKIKYNL